LQDWLDQLVTDLTQWVDGELMDVSSTSSPSACVYKQATVKIHKRALDHINTRLEQIPNAPSSSLQQTSQDAQSTPETAPVIQMHFRRGPNPLTWRQESRRKNQQDAEIFQPEVEKVHLPYCQQCHYMMMLAGQAPLYRTVDDGVRSVYVDLERHLDKVSARRTTNEDRQRWFDRPSNANYNEEAQRAIQDVTQMNINVPQVKAVHMVDNSDGSVMANGPKRLTVYRTAIWPFKCVNSKCKQYGKRVFVQCNSLEHLQSDKNFNGEVYTPQMKTSDINNADIEMDPVILETTVIPDYCEACNRLVGPHIVCPFCGTRNVE
jgi:hypothetical protein